MARSKYDSGTILNYIFVSSMWLLAFIFYFLYLIYKTFKKGVLFFGKTPTILHF
jgi:hypothetical protein